MSENNETKKITIPLQSDDSEFDNFFGLKFGMSITDVAFKCICYGMDILGCTEKRKNITMLVENSNDSGIFFYDHTVYRFFPSFKFYKGEYYLVRMIMQVKKNKDDSDKKLDSELERFAEKFASQLKIKNENQIIHKSTKREFVIGEDDNFLVLCISENGAEEYTENDLDFPNFFAEKCFREFYIVCGFSLEIKKLIANKFNTEELRISLSGLLVALSKSEHDIINFVNFFMTKNHIKYLPDLAKEIKGILTFAPDCNDEKSICAEINAFIEKRMNEISSEEKQKREERKQKQLEVKAEKDAELERYTKESMEQYNKKIISCPCLSCIEDEETFSSFIVNHTYDVMLDILGLSPSEGYVQICCNDLYKSTNNSDEVIKKFFKKWNDLFSNEINIISIEKKFGEICWFDEIISDNNYITENYRPIERIFHCSNCEISVQSRNEQNNNLYDEAGIISFDENNFLRVKYTVKNNKNLYFEFNTIESEHSAFAHFRRIRTNLDKEDDDVFKNIYGYEYKQYEYMPRYCLCMSLDDAKNPAVRLYSRDSRVLDVLSIVEKKEIGSDNLSENFKNFADFLNLNAKLDEQTKEIEAIEKRKKEEKMKEEKILRQREQKKKDILNDLDEI